MSATKILMLGATGVGKSTLSNFIAGDKIFQESCKDSSCTKEVSIRAAKEGTKYENVIIIDTPGILDSDGQDQENMEKITKKLKEIKGDGIKAILLLVNANDTRINDADKKSLCIYCKMFPIIDFFEHVALVFTKTYESFSEKKFKKIVEEKVGDFRVSLEKILSKIVTDINKSENTHIRTPDGLQCFFTDCGEDGEDYDYKRTAPEVDRLVNWCNSQDIMCLDGIDSKVDVDCVRLEEAGEFELKSNEEIINNNKKKLIRRFIKRYKKIDFHGKETIVNGDEPVREEIYFLKRVKESEILSTDISIYNNDYMKKTTKIQNYYRWDKYDFNNNFISYGQKIKNNVSTKSDLFRRNWHDYRVYSKIKYDVFDYSSAEYFNKRRWILFIPIDEEWKKPYDVYKDEHLKKIDKIDDYGNIKHGKWFCDYTTFRRRKYFSPYKVG